MYVVVKNVKAKILFGDIPYQDGVVHYIDTLLAFSYVDALQFFQKLIDENNKRLTVCTCL